jgi:hypothetical protein
MDTGLLSMDRALHHLRTAPAPPEITGMPRADLARSPAASTVARLAAEREIRVSHFEHRAHRPLPAAWIADGEDGAGPQWQDGVLAEGKYASFRHDLLVASFHPGHRPKWSAHELCHALVGFAWAPDRTPLWHATAGRIAELAPTVLWYFLDEIGLRRCPRHRGPTFRAGCLACTRAAADGRAPFDDERAAQWIADADRFLTGELAAIHDTLRTGVPRAHGWGSIDLCSDGIAYARSHLPRLRSIEMTMWAERFVDGALGVTHTSLESLEARAVAVVRAVAEGAPLDLQGDAARWAAMDLASRIFEVHADTEGDARRELVALGDLLAAGESPAAVIGRYAALCEDFVLPPPEEVAAVGYDVPGVASRSAAQIEEGLRTVVPVTMTAIEDAGIDLASRFVADDVPVREPLGIRFAAWLTERAPSPLADLARWEAALRAASGEPESVALGPGDGLRVAEGVRIVESTVDVDELAGAVERGDVMALARDGWPVLEAPLRPSAHVVGRDSAGGLVIAELRPELTKPLRDDPGALPPEVRADLMRLGLLVPARWPV